MADNEKSPWIDGLELARSMPLFDHSNYIAALRNFRAAYTEAERRLGGPVYVVSEIVENDVGYSVNYVFRRKGE